MTFTTCSWMTIPNGLCRSGVCQNILVGKRFKKDTEMESIYNNGCNHSWEFQGVFPENFAQWHCKSCSIVHAQNLTDMMNELQRARQYKIDRNAYVPGHWQCPVCHFYNVVTILNVNTGKYGMAKEHDDPFCPNDGHPMERVTWRQACESTEQTLKSEITRLAAERDTALRDLATAREECERLRGERDVIASMNAAGGL